MNRSAILIVCVLAAAGGAVALFQPWQRNSADIADVDKSGDKGAGKAPVAELGAAPPSRSGAGKGTAESAVGTGESRVSTGHAAGGAVDEMAGFTRRLGWEESAPDASAVFEWNRQLEVERGEFVETHSRPESGTDEVRSAARG